MEIRRHINWPFDFLTRTSQNLYMQVAKSVFSPDIIPNYVLKQLPRETISTINQLFNNTKPFPHYLENIVIIPIPKPNPNNLGALLCSTPWVSLKISSDPNWWNSEILPGLQSIPTWIQVNLLPTQPSAPQNLTPIRVTQTLFY